MPIVCGGLVLIISVLMLVSKVKKKETAKQFTSKSIIPMGAMGVVLIFNQVIGLLGACALVTFLWLKFIEKYSYLRSAVVSSVLFAGVYAIFRMWLNVPVPMGILRL